MTLLNTYPDFVERVDELGFLPLSPFLPGMPSLSEETPPGLWHTGDHESDPWGWKDRAAEEKRLAYGCILNGAKGFVSARLYGVFYAAYHPQASMADRWGVGEVKQTTWQVWQLFEQRRLLNTSEVRHALGVTPKSGASRVDAALLELQREFYLAIVGSRQKMGKDGQLYGWPASVFDRVPEWAPAGWLQPAVQLSQTAAREMILESGLAMGSQVDPEALAKRLFGKS